ncbi:hypothetical protein PT974_12323 [Cladobotryum mycophilum]|uniref:NAD(P)-binding domain-containing protein n=1 Tax=Cladobotryum mycophilum TaxID=491253 RepID=A0ABR0S7T2_9HYPO
MASHHRSWTVTSVIRQKEQVPAIEKLGSGLPGKLNVLVRSIEVTSDEEANGIINEVKPDYVAWSAGAGGKGGAERTYKVDRDAASHFARAAAANSSIARFLLISYNGSRRKAASWWPEGEWDDYHKKINFGVLADYYQAKISADEAFYEATKKSSNFVGINLRPGHLIDEPAGKVSLGKTTLKGSVPRETVAHVADALLAADGLKSGWIDLLQGDDALDAAVGKVVQEGIDTAEGEDIYESK